MLVSLISYFLLRAWQIKHMKKRVGSIVERHNRRKGHVLPMGEPRLVTDNLAINDPEE